MTAKELEPTEYNPYYQSYIDQVGSLPLQEGIREVYKKTLTFLEHIPSQKYNYRYQDGKWTIKEILQHIIDAERIFSYRALCIAREDKTSLPGYDHDAYILPSEANKRSFESLLSEYKAVKFSTIQLFDSFSDKMLIQVGMACNSAISVRALGFIIMGHENHHCEVISERYL